MPIPNDDPACHCAIEGGSTETGEDALIVTADVNGAGLRTYLDPACPHHGGTVQAMQKSVLKGFSIPPPR